MREKKLQKIFWLLAAVVCVFQIALYAFERQGNGAVGNNGTAAHMIDAGHGTAVHMIDVGQGDCILLMSEGQAVLVDAGTADSSETILSYLEWQGVHDLLAVVATHPHADHIGSMADIIHTLPVTHFYMGAETANITSYSKMLQALEMEDITPIVPKDGEILSFASGATLTFLAEDIPDTNLNNRSLLTFFEANGKSMLLMGDAEQPVEVSLLAHHPEIKCDILKVGHHGSDTSSSPAFLKAIQPSVALISCGLGNTYGHPDPQTIANLSGAGIETIHITAEEGSIIIPFPSADKEENQ